MPSTISILTGIRRHPSIDRLLRLFVLLACTAMPACHAEEQIVLPAPGTSSRPLVFGGDWNYRPFHYLDEQEQPVGFDVDLFREIAARSGLKTEFHLGPWDRTLQLLDQGGVDVVPMFITPRRAARYLFTAPFLRRHHLIFGRKGSEPVATIEALAGQRVAVQYAGLAWEQLQEVSPPVRMVPVSVEGDAVLAVAQGRADYAVAPESIAYESILRKKITGVVALSPPVLAHDYAYAVSRSRAELLPRIDAALNEVQAQGERDRLYLKWRANLEPRQDSYRTRMAWGMGLALPALALALLSLGRWGQARRTAAVQERRALQEAELRRKAQEEIRLLAYRDPVTSLPNRIALLGELEEKCAGSALARVSCVLVRLDLIGLDMIRALAGSEACDELIRAVAQCLSEYGRGALIAHLGRGEFAIALAPPSGGETAEGSVQLLAALARRPVRLGGELQLELDCRAGAARFPEDGTDAETLLRAAEIACSSAHEQRSHCVFYNPALEPDPRNLTLLADLHQALEEGTIGHALQPKISLNGGRHCIGAEMLVRWQHPKYGVLSPALFVPLAEQAGMIGLLTLHLFRQALAHCRAWRARGLGISLSINVSVNDLANPALVAHLLEESAGLGEDLVLEVTETDVMRDTERVIEAIGRLRGQGLRISLDDFGTGHSSLTYLQRLAPDELKIDRSFVTGLLATPGDQAIVHACIQLAHALGATVTAEGIEDAATLEWLAAAGCDTAQGFAIARPMPPGEFERWLSNHCRPRPAKPPMRSSTPSPAAHEPRAL